MRLYTKEILYPTYNMATAPRNLVEVAQDLAQRSSDFNLPPQDAQSLQQIIGVLTRSRKRLAERCADSWSHSELFDSQS